MIPLLLLLLSSIETATEHFANGRFEEALDLVAKIPEDHADFAKGCYLAGEIHLARGEAAKAEDDFRAGLRKKPASEPLLTGLGRALLAREEWEEAEATLAAAVKAAPKAGRPRAFLGLVRLQASYGEKGREDLDAGIALAPADAEVARAVVLALLDDEKPEDALREAQRFGKAVPRSPLASFLEALALERLEKYGEAIAAYEEAIKRDAAYLDAHKNLAILCIAQNPLYQDQQRTKKAMQHFERYFALGGSDPELRKTYDILVQLFNAPAEPPR